MVIRLNEITIYLCTKHLEKAEMNIFNEIVLSARLYNFNFNFNRQILTFQFIEITKNLFQHQHDVDIGLNRS